MELLLARGWRGRADQIANVKDTGAVSLSEIGGVQGQEILEISSRRFCRVNGHWRDIIAICVNARSIRGGGAWRRVDSVVRRSLARGLSRGSICGDVPGDSVSVRALAVRVVAEVASVLRLPRSTRGSDAVLVNDRTVSESLEGVALGH